MDFTPKRSQVVSAHGEAQKRKYHPYVDDGGKLWLVADQPNMADNIYVEGEPGRPSDMGFGGSMLTFPLVTYPTDMLSSDARIGPALEVKLKGPWHTNSESFFGATGVDIRDTCWTRVVVSKGKLYDFKEHKTNYLDVQHYEEVMVLGTFKRGDRIAQKIAEGTGKGVFLYIESSGGSSSKPISPSWWCPIHGKDCEVGSHNYGRLG